jgi:hypothetical protein
MKGFRINRHFSKKNSSLALIFLCAFSLLAEERRTVHTNVPKVVLISKPMTITASDGPAVIRN